MTEYDATEQAYKNGYAAGFEAGRESVSIQLTSAWIDAEDETVKFCFKMRDIDWQMSVPLSLEDIRILAHKICPEKHERYYGDEYV